MLYCITQLQSTSTAATVLEPHYISIVWHYNNIVSHCILFCVPLYCMTLYYLYYIHCIVSHCIVSHCILSDCTVHVLWCTVLWQTVLYRTVLCHTLLGHTVLCQTVLYIYYCITLYHVIRYSDCVTLYCTTL